MLLLPHSSFDILSLVEGSPVSYLMIPRKRSLLDLPSTSAVDVSPSNKHQSRADPQRWDLGLGLGLGLALALGSGSGSGSEKDTARDFMSLKKLPLG